MDTELLLDYLAVRVNSEKAKNKDISIELNKRDDVSFNGDQNALNELSSSLDIFPKTFNIVTP